MTYISAPTALEVAPGTFVRTDKATREQFDLALEVERNRHSPKDLWRLQWMEAFLYEVGDRFGGARTLGETVRELGLDRLLL